MLKDSEVLDAWIRIVNADHDDVIAVGRNYACQVRDEIERLRAVATPAVPQSAEVKLPPHDPNAEDCIEAERRRYYDDLMGRSHLSVYTELVMRERHLLAALSAAPAPPAAVPKGETK